MTRTIPAHIEDGRVVPDAPMPEEGEIRSVSIVVEMAPEPIDVEKRQAAFDRLRNAFQGVKLPADDDVKEDYRRYLEEKHL